METWFTSDTHFYHDNIRKFCGRPFFNRFEMNEKIIESWNAVVKDDDIVWHHGDVAFCSDQWAEQVISRLNGRKRLILGNHDYRKSENAWLKIGFEIVLTGAKLKYGKQSINLSHYPYFENEKEVIESMECGYKIAGNDNRFRDDGNWLIHGHVHNNWPKVTGRMINVSTDVWDFKPVNIKQIHSIIDKGEQECQKKKN